MVSACNGTASGAPPADPAQALHRLKDVANIDLPIDDAAVDSSRYLVPLNMPQQPSTVGTYLGSVSMANGNTIELRVGAYTLASDAAQYALWWNTSGVKEYFASSETVSVAVQCGRIVIDGTWVNNHTQLEIINLLHQAYPDCTPYTPQKAPAVAAAPPVADPTTDPTTDPTPTRTPPPAADGFTPRDGTAAASQIVSGALLITNLLVTEEGANNGTVSFTVKNISKQVVNLLPQVMVSEDIGTSRRSGMWGGEQGPGLICHTLGPNQSARITIEGGTSDGGFPINWTSAVVTNGPQGC